MKNIFLGKNDIGKMFSFVWVFCKKSLSVKEKIGEKIDGRRETNVASFWKKVSSIFGRLIFFTFVKYSFTIYKPNKWRNEKVLFLEKIFPHMKHSLDQCNYLQLLAIWVINDSFFYTPSICWFTWNQCVNLEYGTYKSLWLCMIRLTWVDLKIELADSC